MEHVRGLLATFSRTYSHDHAQAHGRGACRPNLRAVERRQEDVRNLTRNRKGEELMNEQYKFSSKPEAKAKAKSLANAGKHGSIVKSVASLYNEDPDYRKTVFYVETDPVGMIRTWEREIFTF